MSVGFKTVPLYGRRRFSFRGTARAQYYSLATAVKRLCIQLLGPLPHPGCPIALSVHYGNNLEITSINIINILIKMIKVNET
jgi:hypothetical protein